MKLVLITVIAFITGILAGVAFEREFPAYPMTPRRVPW